MFANIGFKVGKFGMRAAAKCAKGISETAAELVEALGPRGAAWHHLRQLRL